ncbi:MAG: SANT/Myb-like DNA-binding domain-containing protein [Planctomycetota bacterium]
MASNNSQSEGATEDSPSTPDSAHLWRSNAAPEPRLRLASEPESAHGNGRVDRAVEAPDVPENGAPAENGEPQAVKRGRWSPEELQRLEELYGRRDDAAIARELGRTVPSVRAQAQKLFGDRQRSGPWTPEETERLKDYIGASSTDVIARIFGRHPREVSERIEALDSKVKSGDWTRDEVQRLRQLYGRRTDQDLARILGRPVEEIEEKATEYALRKDKAFIRKLEGASATRMPRWTEAELQILRELYPLRPNLEIAHQLKRSVKSVVSKAYHLGLKKDPQRLREMGRENVALRYEDDEE